MPLHRAFNTFCRHYDEDAVMSDATTSAVSIPVFSPLALSFPVKFQRFFVVWKALPEPRTTISQAGRGYVAMTSDFSPAFPLASPTHVSPLDNFPSK
jgi:hypothetical protein